MKRLKIGCCGFSVSRAEYFQRFSVVEIQQTFYNLPRLTTAERWRQEAREGFEFTAKAWQLITHEPSSPTYRRLKAPIDESRKPCYGSFKPTEEVVEAWEKTLQFIRKLGTNKVVFQCPASFRPTVENKRNIRKFFSSINRTAITCIWEPRGEWKGEEIHEICEEHSLIHCVDPFVSRPQTGSIRYFRLHGISGYKYRYTGSDFKSLREKLDSRFSTYIMFNNIPMLEDAARLKKLLKDAFD
jgi:uncharacterized protein YecE (DUF72 family)